MRNIFIRSAIIIAAASVLLVLLSAFLNAGLASEKASGGAASSATSPAATPGPYEGGAFEQRGAARRASKVTPAACSYIIKPSSACFDSGASGSGFEAKASSGCFWTAVSNDSWITITAGATGAGQGVVEYQVSANNGAARVGTLTISGLTFTVSQDGAKSCALPLMPPSQDFTAQGGAGTTQVPQLSASCSTCSFTATTTSDWITITSSGSNSFSYTVGPNSSGSVRQGAISAAGQVFEVTQFGCSYAISPVSQSVGLTGGAGTFNLTTSSGCQWTAISNESWLTVTSPRAGNGDAQIAYSATANTTGFSRTGQISIAGQTFSVSQEGGGCAYSLSPGSLEVGPGGATSTVNIGAASTCSWTATSNENWLAITSAAAGMGNGSIAIGVAPNLGNARTGSITVVDQTFTVDQAGAADQADLSVSVIASPQPVAAGTRLTYTTTVSNAGPNTAMGVTLVEAVPDGASFTSIETAGSVSAPGPGQTGMVTCALGAIESGKSAAVTLVVNVLVSPGNTLKMTPRVQSFVADLNADNNSATNSTPIKGGGVVGLSWSQPESTVDDPTPAPTNVTVGIASNSEKPASEESFEATLGPIKRKDREPGVAPAGMPPCTPIGYNIYLSTSTPVPTTPANLWETVPPTTTAPAPNAPPGTFYVIKSVWNCDGTITESPFGGGAGDAGGPQIDTVTVGNKIKATGSFDASVQVFIDKIGFAKPSALKTQTLLVQKGVLTDGSTVPQAVSGKTVTITFEYPNGGIATYSYPPD